MEKNNCFYRFISDNYANIRRNLKKGLPTFQFNEDIYHDTLLRCMLRNISDLTDTEMFNYIFIAYKTNLNREHEYYRNKFVEELSDTQSDRFYYSADFVSKMDLSSLISYLRMKFSSIDIECFKDWIYGHPIREIEETHHLTGLTYRIKLIRKFIFDKKLLVSYQS